MRDLGFSFLSLFLFFFPAVCLIRFVAGVALWEQPVAL